MATLVTLHVLALLPLPYRTIPLTEIKAAGGFAYLAPIPVLYPGTFEPDVRLLENGRDLAMPNMPSTGTVMSVGFGRFHHDPGYLLFSTSDNSDPRSNARRYEIVQPWPVRPRYMKLAWLFGLCGAVVVVARRWRPLVRAISDSGFWLPALLFAVLMLANRIWLFLDYPILALHPDSFSYFRAAESITGVSWPSFGVRPPVYPVFLRAVFALWSSNFAVLAAQTLVSFAASLLLIYAVYRWWRAAAVPMAFAAALFLSGIQTLEHDTAMLSESLYTSLLVGTFAALLLGLRTRQVGWFGAASACMGLAILTRPAGMFLLVTYTIVVAWLVGRRFGRRAIVAFAVPLPLLMLSMSLYNMRVSSAFAPSTWLEANLAVGTFVLWEPDPAYPPDINGQVAQIQTLIRRRIARAGTDAATIDVTWDTAALARVFVEGFDQDSLNIAMGMGGGAYETSGRIWIRRIALDAIRKHPQRYAKFVYSMIGRYFAPIPEVDFRVYLQLRAMQLYVDRFFAPERGDPLRVRMGKEFSTGAPPAAVVILDSDPATPINVVDRIVMTPTPAWRAYDLTHRLRHALFERSIWPLSVFIALAMSLLILVRTRLANDAAFAVFLVTISAIGAALVVSLVEFSQPRYSYPMEWCYGFALVSLPFLMRELWAPMGDWPV